MDWIYTALPIISGAAAIVAVLLGFFATLNNFRRLQTEKLRMQTEKNILIAISNVEMENSVIGDSKKFNELAKEFLGEVHDGNVSKDKLPDLIGKMRATLNSLANLRNKLEALKTLAGGTDDPVAQNVKFYAANQLVSFAEMERETTAVLANAERLLAGSASFSESNPIGRTD